MQHAERWLGFGLILTGAIAFAPSLLTSHPTAKAAPHVELTSYRCSEPRVPQAPPPPVAEDSTNPYVRVFEKAQPQLQTCFGAESRVELLITIKPDGSVAKVSHRPDPSTPATRCLTKVIEHLKFPAASSVIAIRLPLTSR